MSEPIEAEATPVYFHDCRVLGPHTRLIRALVENGGYIIYYQHKCPFCSQTSGEKELATGITETETGYFIDTRIAEKLHN